jgi:hypothetical protein
VAEMMFSANSARFSLRVLRGKSFLIAAEKLLTAECAKKGRHGRKENRAAPNARTIEFREGKS